MNLQQLRYARALADTRSFGLASDRCHVTQPSLSNAIAQLERELGRALFVRTTRSVRLSDFGQDLLPNILEVLNAQEALVARARQLVEPDRQLIRIGVSPLIGLAMVDLLTDPFLRDNPKTEIVFREMNLAEMHQMLQAGQLDFVFAPMAEDAVLAADWQMLPLHHEQLVYVGKGQPKPSSGEVVLADLADETFVMVPDACGLTRSTRALFQANGLGLREYPGQAMSYRVLQDWARLGVGAAILPMSKVDPGSGAPIVLFHGQTGGVSIAYHALWRNHAERSSVATGFAAFLSDVAPAILAGLV